MRRPHGSRCNHRAFTLSTPTYARGFNHTSSRRVTVSNMLPNSTAGKRDLVAFGRELRLAREQLQLSPRELAERMDCAREALRLWESGQRVPNIETVWRLELAVQVPKGSLMDLVHPEEMTVPYQLPPLERAIIADRSLTEAQRRSLAGVVAVFRELNAAVDGALP